jgi:ADP-ribose pyrophosphatase YjhB (NUDIX family)
MHDAAFCPRCAAPLAARVPDLDSRIRKVCTRCAFVVYVNPKIAAGTLPVRDGRIALVRRGIEPSLGRWSWPCGYVEIDETVEEAALRETREESGLVVALGGLLGAYSYPVRAGEPHGPATGLVVMAWATEAVEGDLVPGDDAADAAWFACDAIPWDDLAFDSTRRALRDFLGR